MKDIQEISRDIITKHVEEKGYQLKDVANDKNDVRLEISDLKDKVTVWIYHTGSVNVQGKESDLKTELEDLKTKIPNLAAGKDVLTREEPRTTKYMVIKEDIQEQIRVRLNEIFANVHETESRQGAIKYVIRIDEAGSSLTLTQYLNGTLLLQGKANTLFEKSCDEVEKIASPSHEQVIVRFLSGDKEELDKAVSIYTPDLIEKSESEVERILDTTYSFLEDHDRKWVVASQCLCASGIELPEFSPYVMPASKAFEGLTKKLLVSAGIVDKVHFEEKTANFTVLSDKNDPLRKAACDKEKYVDSQLQRLKTSLDKYRNYMLHSDDSFITKVETKNDAEEMVGEIFKEMKGYHEYFSKVFEF